MYLLLALILASHGQSDVPIASSHSLSIHSAADVTDSTPRVLPASCRRFFRLGAELEKRRSWTLAAAAYLAGARCGGPLRPYCRMALGRALRALGRPDVVPTLLESRPLPEALHLRAALLRAWALLDLECWEQAHRELSSLQEMPSSLRCEMAVAKAIAWLGAGVVDSALTELRAAVEGDVSGIWGGRACRLLEAFSAGPDSLVLLDAAARARERRGDLEAAAAHWRARARDAPDSGKAAMHLALARVLRAQGKGEEARELLESLLVGEWRWQVGCEALWELAACALRNAPDETVASAYGDYADRCPDAPFVGDAVWHRARAFERLGDYTAAREQYRALGRARAGEFEEECLFRSALCYYFDHDHAAASALLDSLRVAYPGARNRYWLAKALERTGAVGRAESCFVSIACSGQRPSYYSARAADRVRLAQLSGAEQGWCHTQECEWAELASQWPGRRGAWERARPCLERAHELLLLGARDEAAAECDWALRRSGAHPVVRVLVIDLLASRMAYPQSMRAAYGWWREGGPECLVALLYPRAYRGSVVQVCREMNVDSCLVWALMREESWFDPEAVSRSGAVGLMQLMPRTAAFVAETRSWPWPINLHEPEPNIRLGVAHLSDLLREFPFLEAALAAYNAGRTPARRWLGLARVRDKDTFVESITYGETRSYVQRVVASYAFYRSRARDTR